MPDKVQQQINEKSQQVIQLYQQGRYAQAVPIAIQIRDLRRKALGEEHPKYAGSLHDLAVLYRAMGNYPAAEPLHRQAIEIFRKALGEGHPDYAPSLNNLAVLYRAMGNYPAAEPLIRQAIEIRRKALGEEHPDYASSLNNLAGLYLELGNYAAAEPLYRQSIEIFRKALGEGHPHYAISLHDLAELYREMGNYPAAEPLHRQAIEIRRKTLGEGHPDYATSLDNLAQLYQQLGNYAAAEPLIRQAIEIRRKALGEEHPNYAISLNNLAELYREMGNYVAAEPLIRQSIEISRRALGEGHPHYATSLNSLAALYVATNRPVEALSLMQAAAAVEDRMIGQIFSISSESERMAYLATLQVNLHGLLSLVLQYFSNAREPVQAALDLVLRRKALGAESLAAQRDAVLGGRYPRLQARLQELTARGRQIAQKTLGGPGSESPQAHQKLLAEWIAQKERLEKELIRQIPEMNLEKNLGNADWRAVAGALPAGSALVEFVRLSIFDFKAIPAMGEWRWKPARFLAFVLSAGKPDNIRMIDLGEAEPIEQLITGFRASIIGGERSLLPEEAFSPFQANQGPELRRMIFDPLVPALAGCTRLFLAPDGELTRLPFEALPLRAGRRLIDDYHFSYLSVGRDILRTGVEVSGQLTNSLVVADPDFDLSLEGVYTATNELVLPGRQSRSLNSSALHFHSLPGTRVEGEHIVAQLIAAQLGVQPWFKGDVLEARIKTISSPRILHIATHGFFLEDQQRDPDLQTSGYAREIFGRLSHGLENPLLRSGLVLAGVNTWLQEKSLPLEAEDAILNAEDVSGLDLLDTELVVLSACETGLGAVHVGEGVFGLRRAFVLAGARTLVMSLWKVPDRQTQELMEDFYQRILAGEPRAEALRMAQLAVKAKHPEPLYWAAFICQGDPGPLLHIRTPSQNHA